MTLSDRAQHFHQREASGEFWLLELIASAAPVVLLEVCDPFRGHFAAEQPCLHGRIDYDTDVLRMNVRQDLILDISPNEAVRWLQ